MKKSNDSRQLCKRKHKQRVEFIPKFIQIYRISENITGTPRNILNVLKYQYYKTYHIRVPRNQYFHRKLLVEV